LNITNVYGRHGAVKDLPVIMNLLKQSLPEGKEIIYRRD
jgi:hypothetical protein